MNLNQVISVSKDIFDNIINAYVYGSNVYGTANSLSDNDFIFVVKSKEREQFKSENINISYYTLDEFQKLIDRHEISALECLFLIDSFKLKESYKFEFNLNKSVLRSSLSEKSSNSYVKSKKKLTVNRDYNYFGGIKSMFHAFRIINFGIQICMYGKIIDYSDTNHILYEAYNQKDWTGLEKSLKQSYNNLRTEFRKIAI